MKHIFLFTIIALAITACNSKPKKDYAASAKCQDLGYKVGSDAYDDCLENERASRLLKQQRNEFNRMKQEERDWKLRRY